MILLSWFFSSYIYPLISSNETSKINYKNFNIIINFSTIYILFLFWSYMLCMSLNKISLLFLFNEFYQKKYKSDYKVINIYKNEREIYSVSSYTVSFILILFNIVFYSYTFYFLFIQFIILLLAKYKEYLLPYYQLIYIIVFKYINNLNDKYNISNYFKME